MEMEERIRELINEYCRREKLWDVTLPIMCEEDLAGNAGMLAVRDTYRTVIRELKDALKEGR